MKPTLLAAILVAALAAYVSAATINVPADYTTIQAAVDAASPDDTIQVAAGTYVEQVEISKNLSLVGAGADTIIKSPATLSKSFTTSAVNKPVVYVHDADDVQISNLVLDGDGKGNANYRFMGIAYHNAGGSVKECEIKNVKDTPFSGAQHGVGVGVYNADATARSFTLDSCRLHDIQKTFAVLNGSGLTATVKKSVFTGVGPTGVTAQNGIQFSFGAAGTVEDNVLTGFYYTGANWGASAILAYSSGNVTFTGNNASLSNFGLNAYACTGITANQNSFVGNDWGFVNDSDVVVDASQNWWGTPVGATYVTEEGTVYTGDGDLAWDSYPPKLGIGSPLAKPAHDNVLYLEPTPASFYVKPAETCVVDLKVANLQQPVLGLQAMLNFSSTYFKAGAGEVAVAAGGGVWDNLIWSLWDTGGDLDVAVGVQLGEVPGGGTQADATTAVITLTPTGTEGVTKVVFRPDADPDPGLIESTVLSDASGGTVWPNKVNSANIYIDGTAPEISIDSAQQAAQELLGTTTNAVEGVVSIQVSAGDALAGLSAAPTVTVTPQGGSAESATFVNESPAGTFNYTWTVGPTTPNGTATIDASVADKAGNTASGSDTFNINKHEVTGTVELQSLAPPTGGITRTVTFVATGGASTKTWNIAVSFAAGSATGTFQLADVPAGTTNLSAKTAWNLRRKVAVTYADDRAVVNFTGDSKLLGGDINGTNSINVLDYGILKANWYTSNAVADVNGDGQVQQVDYTVMKSNWFQVGDAQ